MRSILKFFLYGCCENNFILTMQSSITRIWKTWEKRLFNKEEARNYLVAEW